MGASIIAVLGTLLGAVTTYALQSRAQRARDRVMCETELRRDQTRAVRQLLAATRPMRRAQFHRFRLREDQAPQEEQAAAKSAALDHRTQAGDALDEVQLLIGDPEVLARADALVDVTYTLHEAVDQDDADARYARALQSRADLIAAARAAMDGQAPVAGRLPDARSR